MTASAKGAFDAKDAAVKHVAVTILALDRMLADFGPETQQIRGLVKHPSRPGPGKLGPRTAPKRPNVDFPSRPTSVGGDREADHGPVAKKPRADLVPAQALDLGSDVLETRFTVFGDSAAPSRGPFSSSCFLAGP